MEIKISPEEIIGYFNTGMIVLFIAVVAVFLIGFLRGLSQGWKYGTYRFVFFAILIAVSFFTLKPLANAIADFNLSAFKIKPISFDVEINEATTVLIHSSVTTIRETGTNLVTQLLQAYNVAADPNLVTEYALAIVISFASVFGLLIKAIIITIVGNLLCVLLWHLLFKWFIPNKHRKKKNLKLVSGFEQAITSFVILAMFLSPLTGMVNSISRSFERIPEGRSGESGNIVLNSDVYKTVTGVIDTYDNSIFSKVFFSWYADSETGMRFDEAFLTYVSSIDLSSGNSISFMEEFSNVVKAASYALDGGMFSEAGITAESFATFATTQYAPKLLRTFGQSKLIQEIAPIALEFVFNLDEVAEYVATQEGFDYSNYDHAATFNNLANIYDDVIDSGVMDELIDETTGELLFNADTVAKMFSSKYQATFDAVFENLSDNELSFLNDVICSLIYVQAVKEYKKAETQPEGTIVIGLKDLLPELSAEQLACTPEGRPVAIPSSIKNINFASEFQIIFDTLFELVNVDEEFLPLILNPMFNDEGDAFGGDVINGIITLIMDNLDDVEKYIDGKNLEAGKKSLLDSQLIANAVPTFLKIIASSTNEAAGLEGENQISLDSVIAEYRARDIEGKKQAAKEETRSIFSVLRPFVTSEEGKALVTDFDHLPGLYFDKNGSYIGAKEGLIKSLAEGLSLIDRSKVFSNLLPKLINNFVAGDKGILTSALGVDLTLDFAPKDASGNSILGHEISKILLVYAECQEAINFLTGLDAGADIRSLERMFSELCAFKTSTEELQVTKLLTALGENKIFNPVKEDHGTIIYNESIYKLFKMIFDSTGFCNAQMDNDLKDIIMVESFDFGSETERLIELIKFLSDNHVLGSFQSGLTLDSMATLPFGELFAKVGSSQLLGAVLGEIIDSNLDSVAIFSYVDEGGETVKLSFKDITDWEAEGIALQKLMNYASIIGDISSLSFDSIDPEMMSSLFGYLSQSGMFVKTNEDGTHDWTFPKYLSSKVVKIAKGSGDLGQFFTDVEETYVGGEYKVQAKDQSLDDSYTKVKSDIMSYLIENTTDMSLIEDAKQTFFEEGERLSEIIRCLTSSGTMTLLNNGINADFTNFKAPYLRELMDKMSESIIMGRTGITQVLLTVSDMLKSASDSFGYANIMFAFESNELAERKAVGQAIATILETAIDPITGLLGSDGKINASKFAHIEELDAHHFVAPILHALNSTEAFTTLSTFQETTAGITQSTFLSQMSVVLEDSTWYGSKAKVDAILPIIDADVRANGGWDIEIDRFAKVFDDFNTMDFEMKSGFELDGFFKEEKYGEDIIAKLLVDINNSRLFYPGLPEKLETAISSIQTSSLSTTGISLTNANVYHAGKGTVDTFHYGLRPYDEEECYKLASILGKSTLLGSIDLTDISSLSMDDVDNVTDLLADFAQSGTFNTLKEGKTTSVFQEVMGVVIGGDSLKEYYISNTSPKDIANASNYVTSLEKAKYFANVNYPYISNTNSNTDVTNLKDSSDPSSLRVLLKTLISDTDFTDALSNGTLDSLNETKMGLLLDALNKCDWTYDIVPNAIADSVKNQTLDQVELKRANPYYQYEFDITLSGGAYENLGTLLSTPDYTNRYDDNEIGLVAKVVSLVKEDSTLTSDLSSKPKVLKLRRFLEALDDSYSFHLAGSSYLLKADDSVGEFTLTDLPVFEQAMYSLYKQSGLASLAYNQVYDGEYQNYEAKLLESIKNYPDNKWNIELHNLIINDAMDEGLFSVAFDYGMLNGGNVLLDSSDILSKNPTELGAILYAANKVDITSELVAYELQKTINETINLKTYSTVTAKYTVGASSFGLDLDNAVYKLEIKMASGAAPTVSYEKAGSTFNASHTGSNPYTYTLYNGTTITDRPLGKDITISGSGTIESVKVTFTADKEIGLTQAEFDTYENGNHVGAITELMDITDACFYDHVHNQYIDFAADPNALGNLFATSGNTTKIGKFLKSPESFFATNSYGSSFEKGGTDFDGGDIALAGMLSFRIGGYSINLFEYMPDYSDVNFVPGFMNIHDIFLEGDLYSVSSWIDSHIVEAGTFYGMYKALPNIQAKANMVPSFEYNGESINAYLTNTAGWNTFESAFKTGFARKLYTDMRNAAITSAHFSNNITSETLYTPTESDFQGFLTLTKGTLIPLLKDLKVSGLTNVTIAATRLDTLANTAVDSPYKDVIASYYEQAIYEALVANMSASFLTQPSTHQTPFGATGYLRNAAIILEPSLA